MIENSLEFFNAFSIQVDNWKKKIEKNMQKGIHSKEFCIKLTRSIDIYVMGISKCILRESISDREILYIKFNSMHKEYLEEYKA
jgi:hypothetical protein